jgi:hypothetical protein
VRSAGRHWRVLRSLAAAALFAHAAHAAKPEFAASIVTDSRTYQRQSSSIVVAGIQTGLSKVDVSRVTVALPGWLVTGEWEPQTVRSATAKDFRRGSDVFAALDGNRLLLKHPDGSVVTAKIVKREKPRAELAKGRPRD